MRRGEGPCKNVLNDCFFFFQSLRGPLIDNEKPNKLYQGPINVTTSWILHKILHGELF